MRRLLPPSLCLVFFITNFNSVFAQDFEKDGVPDTIERFETKPVDCRETTGVNQPGIADAYPYLSADALRLYFTTNREGGHGRFYISTRNSIEEPFGEPTPLGVDLVDGYYAGTLTLDELTLCMVYRGDMYLSYRKDLNSEFSSPAIIDGQSGGFHFGPAISPDGNQIIVNVKSGKDELLKMYRKVQEGVFEEAGLLPIPDGYEPGPGQFSKDGLSFYFSLEQPGIPEATIWRYSRTTVNDKFVDLEKLPVTINSLMRNFQPSINGDGSVFVFVTSQNDLWEEDDIVLVNDPSKRLNAPEQFARVINNESGDLKVMNKVVSTEVKAFPNPFQNNIVIQSDGDVTDGATFLLYDLRGGLILKQRINSRRTDIQLNHLSSGTYVYQLVSPQQTMISSGKLVKAK